MLAPLAYYVLWSPFQLSDDDVKVMWNVIFLANGEVRVRTKMGMNYEAGAKSKRSSKMILKMFHVEFELDHHHHYDKSLPSPPPGCPVAHVMSIWKSQSTRLQVRQ